MMIMSIKDRCAELKDIDKIQIYSSRR